MKQDKQLARFVAAADTTIKQNKLSALTALKANTTT
jgi:hypothetical protein